MGSTNNKVVLIVEDEPQVLLILVDYLSELGYKVLQAPSSTEAFLILATKPHLDLLITDYRLPDGVSGVMIAEPALKLRPDLKVMFISGYPAEIMDTGSSVIAKAPILAKPFSLDKLQDYIQKLLA
ncbi:response regulator receiver domain-containing protein [Pseudomonas duriflava]|uniref:Response regulator receiver domain-containing protein n=1 Tax=Pseudomonas duriflava TaxID=459528 RepID=A0A562QAW8_9PSED|nr:response regulator [Pseudomonas duriflava]TWI53156.1 response regulator receiver domain-containing protein [Pseudomonas duriflava]